VKTLYYYGAMKIESPIRLEQNGNIKQDAQKARPARPQPMKAPEA
jgi:hypothetical protein